MNKTEHSDDINYVFSQHKDDLLTFSHLKHGFAHLHLFTSVPFWFVDKELKYSK